MLLMNDNSIAESIISTTSAAPSGSSDMVAVVGRGRGVIQALLQTRGEAENIRDICSLAEEKER